MDLKSLGENWERFARSDPLWAIVTWDEKKGGRWDPAEFFATGRKEIADVLAYLDGLGLARQRRHALDFGCGAGRLTQALGDVYRQATGIDISPTMIRLARRHNRHGDHVRYLVNQRRHLACLDGDVFDLVYTNIVLQHMEPRYALGYVREFLRFLSPEGVLVFQLPSERLGAPPPSAVVAEERVTPRLWERGRALVLGGPANEKAVSELHCVPEAVVREIVAANGGRVVDAVENDAAGPGTRSIRYCVVRGH